MVQVCVALITLLCLLAAWPLPSGAQTGSLFGNKNSPTSVSAPNALLASEANVVKTDIMGTNGVIHVIDTVLMPK
jgi:hypothetical protein